MAEPPARSPIALCLAGGGVSGAFFELGAVAALEAGLTGWKARDAAVVVGTSCGAIVGAVVGFGGDPVEIYRALDAPGPHPLRIRNKDLSRFDWGRHLRGVAGVMKALGPAIVDQRRRRRFDLGDLAFDLHRILPSGVFSNRGVEVMIRRAAERASLRDAFEDLGMPLRVTATDLNRGRRKVFGPGHDVSVPVSLAVRASTSIPYYFEPVRIGDDDYIDGQIFDPTHLDLAVTEETRVVIAVSPLRPHLGERTPDGDRRLGEEGAALVLDQSARISAGVKDAASRKAFAEAHPSIPVHFIAPEAGDVLSLMTAAFRPSGLAGHWRAGFEAAERWLEAHGAETAGMLGESGIRPDPGGPAGVPNRGANPAG